jgi:hypothetical protein
MQLPGLQSNINHGLQFVDPAKAALPTTYYHEQSGVGFALRDYASLFTVLNPMVKLVDK